MNFTVVWIGVPKKKSYKICASEDLRLYLQAFACVKFKTNMDRNVFNAIADPTRRSILLSLTEESHTVNALADKFDISRQAVSLHIKYLQECGVISLKKSGRERICSLEVEKLSEVGEWLEPFSKMWSKKFNQLNKLLDELQSKPHKEI